MTRLFRNLLAIGVLFLISQMSISSVFAQQDLIVNGNFEASWNQQNPGFFTNYIPYPSGGMPAGRYCIDNTVDGHGSGWLGGFLPPTGSSGKYMIVNGYGGTNNQNQVVWRQTVNVTSDTWYTFSFKYANLSRYYLLYSEGAKLRFLINGEQPPGAPDYIQLNTGDDDWHTYSNFSWYSGNLVGPIDIEFRDIFDGDSEHGDDFALDNISFVPDAVYTVTTHPINVFDCFEGDPVEINVLEYIDFYPSPDQYTSVEVLTPQNQIPGTITNVYVNNNKIYYNYNDAGYTGTTADFQYQITFHGLTYTDWIHVSLGRVPSDCTPQLPPDGVLCLSDIFSFNPSSNLMSVPRHAIFVATTTD